MKKGVLTGTLILLMSFTSFLYAEDGWRQGEMEIFVRDQGKSFEWKKSKTPDLNRYVEIGKRGGLGIWFIRNRLKTRRFLASPPVTHVQERGASGAAF